MKVACEPPAKSNALLDQKIAELEQRLQRDRAVSRLRTKALKQGMHDSLTSPLALLLAAGSGFAAHRFDLFHKPKSRDTATAAAPAAPDSLLDGMVRAFTLAASLVALMPDNPRSKACEVTADPGL